MNRKSLLLEINMLFTSQLTDLFTVKALLDPLSQKCHSTPLPTHSIGCQNSVKKAPPRSRSDKWQE